MMRVALLMSLLTACLALASEGSSGRRLLLPSSDPPIGTPQASVSLGEAPGTILGEARSGRRESVEPSKSLRVGMVVELKHSNGKGCVVDEKHVGYVCNRAKGQVFRVLDGGGGRLALIEGSESYAGAYASRTWLL